MRDFRETLLQVPAQLQPVAAAALEQVLATRGYSQIIPNATSPAPQLPHFGTMPSPTYQQTRSGTVPSATQSNTDQYDGDDEDDEDGMLDLDTMVKAKQAARKNKKKTALDNLYDVS
jgi:negative regulator of sigma E activity